MNDDTEARKYILKQGEYRRLYSSLLQKHRGALQPSSSTMSSITTSDAVTGGQSDSDPFAEESSILEAVFRTEARNIIIGIGFAASSFVSLRFVKSKYAISTVFGRTKAAAMKKAEVEGEKMGTDLFQKTFANVIEGLFSAWVGYRCYDYLSHYTLFSSHEGQVQNNQVTTDSVDAIAALPLCKGRSKIAEAICPEWIHITTQKIPIAYWRALREGKLRDERTWNAIQTFSKNCERRFSAEKAIRKEFSMSDHQAVILPSRLDTRDKSHTVS